MQNLNPKKNPFTTYPGIAFILLSLFMMFTAWIAPAYGWIKEEPPFAMWVPVIPLAVGILLCFIDDNYFGRLFGLGERIAEKKSGIEGDKK